MKSPRFLPGIDVLLKRHKRWLRTARIGLVSHLPAVNHHGTTSAELLHETPGIKLRALFGPEHGFFGIGVAGEKLHTAQHPQWRIPVYSLYGDTRRPTTEMFRNLDVIIVDLQDLGARCYTFSSTLRYVLEKAAELKKTVIVADRPIPLPNNVDGAMLDPNFESFVACIRTPMSYGMTPGETAGWLKADLGLAVDLRVAAMQGYERDPARGPDWPPWIPPSQGIRAWETGYCYLATVFSEALPAIHIGRNSNLAFQVFSAPWMQSAPVCKALNRLRLPGVVFHPHPYKVTTEDTVFDGVRITVPDPTRFRPVSTGIHVLSCLQNIYGTKPLWQAKGTRPEFFDKLYGTDAVRLALLRNVAPDVISSGWIAASRSFRRTRTQALMY